MKNILVAIDFENRSKQLFYKATELGKAFNAKLWFLHVAAPEPDFVGFEVGPQYIRDTRAEDLRAEHRILQSHSAEAKELGLESEGLLIQGSTLEMIMEEAAKLKIDTIILGHHHHSFLYNLFTEDTAVELVKRSNIPLYIIPLD